MQALVGIIMGSTSDWDTMEHAASTLESLGIPFEVEVVSAHRTPDKLFDYAESAAGKGIEVIIAGAGGAAHLPGMTAAKTSLPVLGVPVQSKALDGMDSLLSIAQMPAGIPVGTLAIGRAAQKECLRPVRPATQLGFDPVSHGLPVARLRDLAAPLLELTLRGSDQIAAPRLL